MTTDKETEALAALEDCFKNGEKGSRATSHDNTLPWEEYTEIPDIVLEKVIAALQSQPSAPSEQELAIKRAMAKLSPEYVGPECELQRRRNAYIILEAALAPAPLDTAKGEE